ncbi:phage tail protein [Enterobacter ludwigii]|uniref:phage tail-collar fiber domain-containing protein n=1 Tax=Enterobacter ludwigii TaxID=299767 RepID=UPI003BA09F5E
MAEKYYSILTNRGKELEAQSTATGKPVIIKDFVVGDGNGQAVKPDPAQTKLIREVYRNAISALQVSPDQANQFIAQLVLPVAVGGFVVREVGLLTDAGELYSVANCAAIEKPENGVSVSLQYRLAVSETANVELKVATGDGLFLRIDKNLAEIAAKGEAAQKSSREAIGVLDATTARKGLVQLSSATDSASEALAATPKAVKAAYDLAKGKYTAQDATTAQKGIVQLSSATDSASETLAATPKAVKSANDNANGRVPSGRKVNGRALSTDINITAQDIFNGQAVGIGNAEDLNAYTTPGLYYQPANAQAQTGKNYPEANAGSLEVYKHAGITQIYRIYNNSRAYIRTLYSGAWTAWTKQYDAANKPTAGDVGALPIGGGRLTGILEIYNAAPIIQLTESDTGKKYFLVADGSGFRINEDTTAGNEILVYTSASKQLRTSGQYVPGDWANFDARYQAKGNYTPAGQAYTKAESDGKYQLKGNYALVGASYTKAESDGRYQPKGNYTPAGEAYTKAQSDARYGVVNGLRRGGQQVRNPTDAWFGNWESPAGCVLTGVNMENRSDGRKLGVYYRQLQYLNKQTNAWVNVGD